MKLLPILSLAVLAVISRTEAAPEGSHKYDGSISFDLAGNSTVQRRHVLDLLWKAVQDAIGRANGVSSNGEGSHQGSGRIRGVVNFAGERPRGGRASTTSSTNEVEEEISDEEIEEKVTFSPEDDQNE